MAAESTLILAAAGTAVMSGIAFLIGLSKNRQITKEDAAQSIKSYDAGLSMADIVISENGRCAFAITTNKKLLLINSMGDELAVRQIERRQIRGNGDVIGVELADLGYAPVKHKFNPIALEELLGGVNG